MGPNTRILAGRSANSHHSGPASPLFSAVDRHVLPLSVRLLSGSRSHPYGKRSEAVDGGEDGADHRAGQSNLGQLEGDGAS